MSQKVLEAKIEKMLILALDEMGIMHIKGNSRGIKGYPDRLVFADSIYFVEIKVGKELGSYYKPTPWQKKWRKIIEDAKGEYRLLTGEEEIKNFIEEIKKKVV